MAAEKQFERSAYDSYLRKLSEEEDGFRHSFRTAFFQAMHEELTGRQYEVLWMGEVEGMTGKEIAARLGISLRQAKTVLGDLARLETYKKRSEAAKLRAQICVNKSAEEAARRQAALLLDGEVNETISQRAAKDILDRAGVRVPKESRSDVVIRFAQGAPPLGMPESAEKGKEERHGA